MYFVYTVKNRDEQKSDEVQQGERYLHLEKITKIVSKRPENDQKMEGIFAEKDLEF